MDSRTLLVYDGLGTRMKLTLRPEWRLRPLSSFLGCFDLKTGVTVAILFAVSSGPLEAFASWLTLAL